MSFRPGTWASIVVPFSTPRKRQSNRKRLTICVPADNTEVEMQLSFNKSDATLADLREGQNATLVHLDLPEDTARRLMELGFLPGHRISAARSAPGGDPRVFRVDGSEVALRRETAIHLRIQFTD